jgi:diaminopropionate ammonia-lyase
LVNLTDVAAELALRRVWVKDESYRLGLPAFKVLGASWAIYRALSQRLGHEPADWTTLSELRDGFEPVRPLTLVAATDGNHGRAVARVAGWLGCSARVYVSRSVPSGRAAGIRAEGADVVVVDGSFDDAVEAAAGWSDGQSLLIPDTALSVDDVVPEWICDGYSTMFWEIDEQLAELGEPRPDLVVIQIGVGSLAAAAVTHFRQVDLSPSPLLIGVEPRSAACVFESAQAQQLRAVLGPHTSVMDCLNAGKPSVTGLPAVLAGFDAFVAVSDETVWACVESLTRAGVVAGTTGAAGLVGLRELEGQISWSQGSTALLVNTEGLADPAGYAAALAKVAALVDGTRDDGLV